MPIYYCTNSMALSYYMNIQVCMVLLCMCVSASISLLRWISYVLQYALDVLCLVIVTYMLCMYIDHLPLLCITQFQSPSLHTSLAPNCTCTVHLILYNSHYCVYYILQYILYTHTAPLQQRGPAAVDGGAVPG